MILVIDNYDSFVENLARYCRELGHETLVRRNDAITLNEIHDLNPSHIVISPGPDAPDQAGVTLDVIKRFTGKIPILGVCLGHQAIGQAMGMQVAMSGAPVHGKASEIRHNNSRLFHGIPDGFRAGRYHSLVLDPGAIPDMIQITAWTDDGFIMGIQHQHAALYGVQFHPESILTEYGHKLLENFFHANQN